MIHKSLSCGLYAITDAHLVPDDRLINAVEMAILGGARLIQYRDKSIDYERRLTQARALNGLCRTHNIPLIINDDVALVREVGAAGIHLGQQDTSLARARTQLGDPFIIGVSCYDRLDLALEAAHQGADYVAFGSFFPSVTKDTGIRASLTLLQEAKRALALPIVAIGGITPTNGKALVAAGADYLAIISGVFGQADIGSAARAYARLYDDHRN